jgi:hypothetical protein
MAAGQGGGFEGNLWPCTCRGADSRAPTVPAHDVRSDCYQKAAALIMSLVSRII